MSVVAAMKEKIHKGVKESLERAKEKGKITYQQLPEFVVEVPREKQHGDFATNAAMLLAKQARTSPRQIAEIIYEHFQENEDMIERMQIAGPGFVNFYIRTDWVYQVIPRVIAEDSKYGMSDYGKGEKVQVEFVSANPTGLLHMGNARGAALGDVLSSILQASGYQVTREFYINDAGNQIGNFGKSLEARYLQLLGQDVPFPEEGYHGEDITDSVKRIIEEVGDKYQSIDTVLRREFLIQKALAEKIALIKADLERFGVKYDVWFSEQSLHDSGVVQETIQELQAKEYIYEKEGAFWFKSTLFGEEKDEVIVRANGVPTYYAADIAYHKNKFMRGFNKVINIWGADHHGHVARMKGAMQALGYEPQRLQVILMQLVRLFRGEEIVRMSKRSGQYVTLNELIDEVGKDAARYFFVMRSYDSHLDFDLELAKRETSENPVYYVQYAHARINSILKACPGELPAVEEVDLKVLKEEAEIELIRKIADLPEEIISAAVNMEPHRITRYAHDLASLFHSFYNSCRVLTDEKELRDARLLLVDAARISLRNVLYLLGVSAPERM